MVLSKHSGQKPWDTRTSDSIICSSQSPLHFTLRHTQQTVRIFFPLCASQKPPRARNLIRHFFSALIFQTFHQMLHLPTDAAATDNGFGNDPDGMHYR